MATRKGRHGGARQGAGRPPETGEPRPHRVVVFLSDRELAQLRQVAEERDVPLGTAAYRIVARSLRRRK